MNKKTYIPSAEKAFFYGHFSYIAGQPAPEPIVYRASTIRNERLTHFTIIFSGKRDTVATHQ